LCVTLGEGGSIMIHPHRGEANFYVIGSNVEMSVEAGERVNSVTLFPQKGQQGIVALYYGSFDSKGRGEWIPFFLGVNYKGDTPYVELKQPWVPPAGRMGQVKGHKVVVRIKDHWFISPDSAPTPHYPHYVVEDPSILCQYLTGDVEADVVFKAAREQLQEVSAHKQVKRLEIAIKSMGESLHRRYGEEVMRHVAEVKKLHEERGRWIKVAQRLARALQQRSGLMTRWAISKEIGEAIEQARRLYADLQSVEGGAEWQAAHDSFPGEED